MSDRRVCAACGEGAKVEEARVGGVLRVRCGNCGLPLGGGGPPGGARFRKVIVADDSPFFLQTLEDVLRDRRASEDILRAEDGARALELATAALRARSPARLVILDLMMPRLNGLHAAVALRAVEAAFGSYRSDILFLSTRRLDLTVRPLVDEVAPAYYLDKGGEGGAFPDRLGGVLDAISGAARLARRG